MDYKNLQIRLPKWMSEQEDDAAMAWSLSKLLRARAERVAQMSCWPEIASMDEKMLDFWAQTLRLEWWKSDWTLEKKREMLSKSEKIRYGVDTFSTLQELLRDYFEDPALIVQEWYSYGGQPYTYRILTNNTSVQMQLRYSQIMETVARQSQSLDGVFVGFSMRQPLFLGGLLSESKTFYGGATWEPQPGPDFSPLNTGIFRYFPLQENLTDSVTGESVSLSSGTPVFQTSPIGGNELATVKTSGVYFPAGSISGSAFSISLWLNKGQVNRGNFFDVKNGTVNYLFASGSSVTAGRRFGFNAPGYGTITKDFSDLDTNIMHHVAFSIAPKFYKFWLDGALVRSDNNTKINVSMSSFPVRIFNYCSTTGAGLGPVAIYNRVLSDEEALLLYQAGLANRHYPF